MKNIAWLLSVCLVLVLSCGACNKQPKPSSASGAAQPAVDVELSVVPGVSIKRRAESQVPVGGVVRAIRHLPGGGMEAIREPLFDVFCQYCPFEGRFHDVAPLPDGVYDITVVPIADDTAPWPLLKEAFEKSFGVRIVQATESVEVQVLKRDATKPLGMQPPAKKGKSWGTAETAGGFGYQFRDCTIEDLVDVLEKHYVETPVLDETGLQGSYDFVLAMDHWHPETMPNGVEKLGLVLVKERRDLEVMRIEKAPAIQAARP